MLPASICSCYGPLLRGGRKELAIPTHTPLVRSMLPGSLEGGRPRKRGEGESCLSWFYVQGASHISPIRRAQTRTLVPEWKELRLQLMFLYSSTEGKELFFLQPPLCPLLIILKTSQGHNFLCSEVCAYGGSRATVGRSEVTRGDGCSWRTRFSGYPKAV